MARRLIWATEKTRGAAYRRAGCSHCGWLSEVRPIRGSAYFRPEAFPANWEAIRGEFRSHDCGEFPGGTRKWNVNPR